MGAYVYHAVLCASPILDPFAKKGTKPIDYMEKPFDIGNKEKDHKPLVEKDTVGAQTKEEQERLKAIVFFKSWASALQKK